MACILLVAEGEDAEDAILGTEDERTRGAALLRLAVRDERAALTETLLDIIRRIRNDVTVGGGDERRKSTLIICQRQRRVNGDAAGSVITDGGGSLCQAGSMIIKGLVVFIGSSPRKGGERGVGALSEGE